MESPVTKLSSLDRDGNNYVRVVYVLQLEASFVDLSGLEICALVQDV